MYRLNQWLLIDTSKDENNQVSVGNANSLHAAQRHAQIAKYHVKTQFSHHFSFQTISETFF